MPTSKYDWDNWFDQDCFLLSRGGEYVCSQSSMVQNIRNAATKRGLKVQVEEDGNSILVQVFRPKQEDMFDEEQ